MLSLVKDLIGVNGLNCEIGIWVVLQPSKLTKSVRVRYLAQEQLYFAQSGVGDPLELRLDASSPPNIVKYKFNVKQRDLSMKLNSLFEGLIYSAPIDKVKKALLNYEVPAASSGLSQRYLDGLRYNAERNITIEGNKIKIKTAFNIHSFEYFKKLLVTINNLGWFCSGWFDTKDVDLKIKSVKQLYSDYDEHDKEYAKEYGEGEHPTMHIVLFFEAKYDITYNKPVKTLYHLTPTFALEKIEKIGLVPKALNKMSTHPERIYFCLSKSDILELAESLFTYSKYFIYDFDTKNKVERPGSWTLLQIDAAKANLKLYEDPNFLSEDGEINGVYTIQNVAPSCITKLQTLDNLEKISTF